MTSRSLFLATLFALTACQATPPDFARPVTLEVQPTLNGERQLLAATYTRASIHHLLIKLSSNAQPVASASVPKADLDKRVTFGRLQRATTYHIVAEAYRDAAETQLISDPAGSSVDFTTGSDFQQANLATLPVQLVDRPFAGTTGGSFAVTDGVASGSGGSTPSFGVNAYTSRVLAGDPSQGADGYVNATGSSAHFGSPRGIAVGSDGTAYVCDTTNHCIRQITPQGEVTTLAGPLAAATPGNLDGQGTNARFNNPEGIAITPDGTLYVADTGNHCIRKIDTGDPNHPVTTIAGNIASPSPGSTNGVGTGASFNQPKAIAVGPDGALYVGDYNSHGIRKLSFSDAGDPMVTADNAKVTLLVGAALGHVDGDFATARFFRPWGLVADANGNLVVADYGNLALRKIDVTNSLVGTFVGNALEARDGSQDGKAKASLGSVTGIARDAAGWFYVVDTTYACIRKVSPTGTVTTVAGNPETPQAGFADGTGWDIRFEGPNSVAVGPGNKLYVTETTNRCIRILE